MVLERQREGIAKAKGEGRYKGQKPTALAKTADIGRLADEGVTREGIAQQLDRRGGRLPGAASGVRPAR